MASADKIITLAYMYGPRNSGDMALNLGALDVLRSCGDFNIFAVSRFSELHPDYLETKRYLENLYRNVQVVPFPVLYDRKTQTEIGKVISFVKGASLYFPSIKKPLLKKNEVYECIKKSNLLIFNGGNLLFARNIKDFFRLGGITYPLQLARALKTPFGFFPQSLPDISFTPGRTLVSRLLDSSGFCWFRESKSLGKAREMGISHGKQILDLAFFISGINRNRAKEIMEQNNLEKDKFVPIILRASSLGDQGILSENLLNNLITWTTKLSYKLCSQSLEPVFVVQTKQDLDISLRMAGVLQQTYPNKREVSVIEEYDPLVLRGLYEEAKAIFTYRLHAAIFALSVGTPAIGIYRKEWGPKMPGIYQDLGISDLCFDANNNETILERHTELMSIDVSDKILKTKHEDIRFIKISLGKYLNTEAFS